MGRRRAGRTLLQALTGLGAPRWVDIAVTLAIELVSVGIGVLSPVVLKVLVDTLSGEQVSPWPVIWLVAAFVGTWAGASLIGAMRAVFSTRVSDAVATALTTDAVRAQLHALCHPQGANSSAVMADLERLPYSVQTVMEGIVWRIIPLVLQVAISFALVAHLVGARFAILLVVTLLAYTIVTRMTAGWHARTISEVYGVQTRSSAFLADILRNAPRVVFSGMTSEETLRAEKKLTERRLAVERMNGSMVRIYALQFLVLGGGLLLLMDWGATAVADGTITVGAFVMLHTYALRLVMPLAGLGYALNQAGVALANIERVGDMADAQATQAAEAGPLPEPGAGRIVVTGLSAGYDARTPVLTDVDFEIEPGAFVAVVGANGSGKSTLAQVLAGLIEPVQGTVEIAGHDIRSVPEGLRHRFVTYVPQHIGLFDRTVRENGLYPPTRLSEAELRGRLVRWRFSPDLATASPTALMDEEGRGLSGGQRQKLELARLSAMATPVLILDEATSALDAQSERRVTSDLMGFLKGQTTVLFITHRAEIAAIAPLTLYLKDGGIEAFGAHEILMEASTAYRAHWKSVGRAEATGGTD